MNKLNYNVKNFIEDLVTILFKYGNNNNIIKEIFAFYNNSIYDNSKLYFKKIWGPLIRNSILNYSS